MKGIARTQKEIEFHDRVAALGCISCRQEGIFNPWVSIHHAHGRTKPGCHMWVLPLCEPHHQDNGTAIARHPYKRRWEAKYGNEDDLIRQMWAELGVEFTEPVRVAKPVDRNRPKKSNSVCAEVGVVKLREIKSKGDGFPSNKDEDDKAITDGKVHCGRPINRASFIRPKAKIKNRDFNRRLKCSAKENTSPDQQLTVSKNNQNHDTSTDLKIECKNRLRSASAEQKDKSRALAKLARHKYLEDNKDVIEAKKKADKEYKKKLRDAMKAKIR